jgi:hypothetical protein
MIRLLSSLIILSIPPYTSSVPVYLASSGIATAAHGVHHPHFATPSAPPSLPLAIPIPNHNNENVHDDDDDDDMPFALDAVDSSPVATTLDHASPSTVLTSASRSILDPVC